MTKHQGRSKQSPKLPDRSVLELISSSTGFNISNTIKMKSSTLLLIPLLLSSLLSHALPQAQHPLSAASPRPLVIWHGLGDTSLSPGITDFIEGIQDLYPGIFVYSVQIPEGGSVDDERKAGFYGNATLQVEEAAAQLMLIPELADGFDAIGFSQGGLFLRSYLQRFNGPPILNLITFGSPHMGISRLLPCGPRDLVCIIARRSAERAVYGEWAQSKIVQAGYYRDVERLDEYLEANKFLTTLNGELEAQPLARENMAQLENFVAVIFDNDVTVFPKESAQFGSPSPKNTSTLLTLQDTPFLWAYDHIGLRALEARGGLEFAERCKGAHMDLGYGVEGDGCGERVIKKWVGWDKK